MIAYRATLGVPLNTVARVSGWPQALRPRPAPLAKRADCLAPR